MRLGINFMLWTTDVAEPHLSLMAPLRAAGFDGVEIPLFERDADHYRWLGQAIAAEGLERTASTSLLADTDPISPDPALRAAAGDRLRWAIENAAALGSTILCGPMHSAWSVFRGAGPSEQELEWSAEVLRTAGDFAADHGVTLMLEPLNRFECYLINTARQGCALVDRVAHPSVRMLYDTHHAHLEEPDVGAAITGSRAAIGHVHASENHRGTPGDGLVDWATTIRSLHENGYDDWLVIESFSRAMPEFAAAVRIWRDFAASPEVVYTEGARFLREAWERYRP